MAYPAIIVALVAAAVAATASTAYRGATEGYADVNDAFGQWLKSFFMTLPFSSTGAAINTYGFGGDAGATTTTGVDSGMFSGISGAELTQGAAAGSGQAAAETAVASEMASGATAESAAAAAEPTWYEPGIQDVPYEIGSEPSWWESFDLGNLNSQDFSKELLSRLGVNKYDLAQTNTSGPGTEFEEIGSLATSPSDYDRNQRNLLSERYAAMTARGLMGGDVFGLLSGRRQPTSKERGLYQGLQGLFAQQNKGSPGSSLGDLNNFDTFEDDIYGRF